VYVFRFVNSENLFDILFSVRNLINKSFTYFLTGEKKFPPHILAFKKIEYDGFNQMENIEYSYLEAQALQTYLLKNDLEALKNYLAIHHTRFNLLSKNSQSYETACDLVLGIGAYIGFKALNLNDSDFIKQVTTTYDMLSCPSYTDTQQIGFCMLLAQYYLSGPALGWALDKAQGNNWKTSINAETSPENLLEKIYPMNESEINQRVTKSKTDYHFALIKEKTENKLKYYLNEMKEQQNNYAKLPGAEINFDYRYCKPDKYQTKFREEFDINNNKTLFTYYNMQFECEIANGKVSIEFKYIPFFFKKNSIVNNEFKLPNTTTIYIDNKPEILGNIVSARKKLNFRTLKIQTDHVIINITGSGWLNAETGQLKISPQATGTVAL